MSTAKSHNSDQVPAKSPVVVRRYLDDWKPKRKLSKDALGFVRRTAKKCRPQSISEASTLVDALTDFVVFLTEHGVPVRPNTDLDRIFDDNKLTAWERDLLARSESGAIKQSTFNSRISRLKVSLTRLGGTIEHGDFLLGSGRTRRGPLTPPIPEEEFERWLQVAEAQPQAIRLRFLILLLACRGAGLGSTDFRHLRGNDIVRRSDGATVITVRGRTPRTAVVLDRFATALLAASHQFGDELVVGTWAYRTNPTSDLVDAVLGGQGLPRPMPRALRRAYVIEMLHANGSSLVLQQQLGGGSLSEIEGAAPYVDTARLDRTWLRRGHPAPGEVAS